eukprot:CAMPEP_0169269044 /NCGR_PEP_ID=MMETSP1016-20121227/48189_1 /TAXON_ID=342587 /ORGANISM="Karlodinium micrum, Strain CCMP2283" /LENGTH=61 /DNA_ID=CAMNT_0009353927 /DNA_START=49 /DNA_END=231 /DNA_ORIENTATION=+
MVVELESPEELQSITSMPTKNIGDLTLQAKLFAAYLMKGEDCVHGKVFAEFFEASDCANVF